MRVRPLGEDITFAPQFRLAIPKLRDARRRTCPALVNPHDLDGLKDNIEQAALVSPAEARRRMRSMRRRVTDNDVARWAAGFLDALRAAPPRATAPERQPKQISNSRDVVRPPGT
jgi:hypothetical protein